jgi:hypothetical protein
VIYETPTGCGSKTEPCCHTCLDHFFMFVFSFYCKICIKWTYFHTRLNLHFYFFYSFLFFWSFHWIISIFLIEDWDFFIIGDFFFFWLKQDFYFQTQQEHHSDKTGYTPKQRGTTHNKYNSSTETLNSRRIKQHTMHQNRTITSTLLKA